MTSSESFFDVLKTQRESQNIEISEICDFTKISPKYIEAIEVGDFTILPEVYMRLFLKAYANFIGADSAEALNNYEFYTTGKITQSDEFNKKYVEMPPTSSSHVGTEMDSNPQISPKQIITGVGIVSIIFILLWWTSKITAEQSKNSEFIQPKVEVTVESIADSANKILKPEINPTEQKSVHSTNQIIKAKTNKQSTNLPNKFPLNDNDFLSENFYTSKTKTNLVLSPPYNITVFALDETKVHISTIQEGIIEELINQVVPKNWQRTLQFDSTINFEFWSSNHISMKLNTTSIDNFLEYGDMAIRGSYESEKSQLYLSFYKR